MPEERLPEAANEDLNQLAFDDLFGDLGVTTPSGDIDDADPMPTVPDTNADGENNQGVQTPPEETPPVPAEALPSENAPPSEAPAVATNEVEEMRKEMLRMAELLAKAGISSQAAPVAQEQQVNQAVPVVSPPPQVLPLGFPVPTGPLDFLKDVKLDDVIDKPEKFNEVLNSVVSHSVEQVLRAVPQYVNQLVNEHATTHAVVQDFYRANEDLLPYKQFVGFVSAEVLKGNPSWSLDQVLTETGKVARERLRIAKPAATPPQANQPTSQRAPAIPGAPTRANRPEPAPMTSVEAEIVDLL